MRDPVLSIGWGNVILLIQVFAVLYCLALFALFFFGASLICLEMTALLRNRAVSVLHNGTDALRTGLPGGQRARYRIQKHLHLQHVGGYYRDGLAWAGSRFSVLAVFCLFLPK